MDAFRNFIQHFFKHVKSTLGNGFVIFLEVKFEGTFDNAYGGILEKICRGPLFNVLQTFTFSRKAGEGLLKKAPRGSKQLMDSKSSSGSRKSHIKSRYF